MFYNYTIIKYNKIISIFSFSSHIINPNFLFYTTKYHRNILQPTPAETRGVSSSIYREWGEEYTRGGRGVSKLNKVWPKRSHKFSVHSVRKKEDVSLEKERLGG